MLASDIDECIALAQDIISNAPAQDTQLSLEKLLEIMPDEYLSQLANSHSFEDLPMALSNKEFNSLPAEISSAEPQWVGVNDQPDLDSSFLSSVNSFAAKPNTSRRLSEKALSVAEIRITELESECSSLNSQNEHLKAQILDFKKLSPVKKKLENEIITLSNQIELLESENQKLSNSESNHLSERDFMKTEMVEYQSLLEDLQNQHGHLNVEFKELQSLCDNYKRENIQHESEILLWKETFDSQSTELSREKKYQQQLFNELTETKQLYSQQTQQLMFYKEQQDQLKRQLSVAEKSAADLNSRNLELDQQFDSADGHVSDLTNKIKHLEQELVSQKENKLIYENEIQSLNETILQLKADGISSQSLLDQFKNENMENSNRISQQNNEIQSLLEALNDKELYIQKITSKSDICKYVQTDDVFSNDKCQNITEAFTQTNFGPFIESFADSFQENNAMPEIKTPPEFEGDNSFCIDYNPANFSLMSSGVYLQNASKNPENQKLKQELIISEAKVTELLKSSNELKEMNFELKNQIDVITEHVSEISKKSESRKHKSNEIYRWVENLKSEISQMEYVASVQHEDILRDIDARELLKDKIKELKEELKLQKEIVRIENERQVKMNDVNDTASIHTQASPSTCCRSIQTEFELDSDKMSLATLIPDQNENYSTIQNHKPIKSRKWGWRILILFFFVLPLVLIVWTRKLEYADNHKPGIISALMTLLDEAFISQIEDILIM